MLINVSRFTAVQDDVRDMVDATTERAKQHIRNFSKLEGDAWKQSSVLNELSDLFAAEYSGCEFDWGQVRTALFEATAPIVVRSVNQKSGAASLDYAKHEDAGLRVIAVGGNSLSRGLTLEGLCISYFHRSPQAYDTLLQMGRWFGYRKGYEDICRLWITADAQQWYSHVASATEELRDEVRRMRHLDLTPKDFGLKVRSHPDSLIVTARNKMRKSQTVIKQISWSGEGAETTKLRTKSNGANIRTAQALIRSLKDHEIPVEKSEWGNPIARKVPKEVIARFINSFEVHPHNFKLFVADEEKAHFGLGKFIADTDVASLQFWDVVFPQGGMDTVDFLDSGIRLKPVQRVVTTSDSDQTVLISGTKARVGSRGVEREGMSKTVVNGLVVQAKAEGKNVADHMFRSQRERPLLLIYPVVPHHEGDKGVWKNLAKDDIFVAYGLSFPRFDNEALTKTVAYRVNTTWLRDHAIDDDEFDGDDSDD